MTPKEREMHVARREFAVGMTYHDQGIDFVFCQNKYQEIGWSASAEMKQVKDKFLKTAYTVAESECVEREPEPEPKTAKTKTKKLTTGLGDFADEQLQNVVGILEAEGWTVKPGKTSKEIKSWGIFDSSKKIGNLYLFKGWWEIDGKALELYGDKDAFDAALIDNGIEDLLEND